MRILFLTHRLPYAPNRGDRIRAWHILQHLSREHEVMLVSLAHDKDEAAHLGDLDSVATVRVAARVPHLRNRVRGAIALSLGSRRPLTHLLLASPAVRPALEDIVGSRPPDVVLASCSSMARFALEPPLDRFPLVIDMIDADSAKWASFAAVSSPPLAWIYRREARLLSRFEAAAMRRAAATLVVNDREREILQAIAPDVRVLVVPVGVDLAYLAPPHPPTNGRNVVFCGVMDYPPNEAGAVWLATEIWPSVRQRHPDATLSLVGARPTAAVKRLSSAADGIEVTGTVDDVRPYLWRAAVAAAPLKTARGVQNKVLEAIAAGLPVAVTTVVREGLPAGVASACLSADGAGAFADSVVNLLSLSPDERRRRAATADLSELSWEACLQPLVAILEGAKNRPSQGVR